MRRITVFHRTPRRNPGLLLLDRVIGDALVAAMLILGFVFCLGAARATERHATTVYASIPAVAMDLQR